MFDNDAKGLQEFKGGLKSDKFKNLDISDDGECRIKKHKEASIYGLLLPVPANMQHFIFKDQNLNVFETEHYFPKALLEEKKMLEDHPVPEIYKIKDSKSSKKAFANDIAKINDRSIFANFIYLFKELDRIFNKSDEIEYFD